MYWKLEENKTYGRAVWELWLEQIQWRKTNFLRIVRCPQLLIFIETIQVFCMCEFECVLCNYTFILDPIR